MRGGGAMPKRRTVGTENLIGQNVVLLRKRKGINETIMLAQLQVRAIDIGQSALSALEGQVRKVSDKEMLVLADILGVTLEELFNPATEEETQK